LCRSRLALRRVSRCFSAPASTAYPPSTVDSRQFRLTDFRRGILSGRPAHRGRLRRRARVGAGCGVPRARLVTVLPGGDGNRTSATTSGREELTGDEALVRFMPRRTEAINPAVERRLARVPRHGTQGAPNGSAVTRDLCACGRFSSANGCRCTRSAGRRSASLIRVREEIAKLGGHLPRENESVYL
jgi:hypothetical protein